jgi:hypothetical protein
MENGRIQKHEIFSADQRNKVIGYFWNGVDPDVQTLAKRYPKYLEIHTRHLFETAQARISFRFEAGIR